MLQLSRVTAATVGVLRVLTETSTPLWGLQVIAQSGRGSGTVYPLLERLETDGWLVSEWESEPDRRGPRRRLYRLTDEGEASASELLRRIDEPVVARRPREVTA